MAGGIAEVPDRIESTRQVAASAACAQPEVTPIRQGHAPSSRLAWHLTLFSAGLLYTTADLVFNLEIPLLGAAIVLLLARELTRRDEGRET